MHAAFPSARRRPAEGKAQLLDNGASIILDGSASTIGLAEQADKRKRLCTVASALDIATFMATKPSV